MRKKMTASEVIGGNAILGKNERGDSVFIDVSRLAETRLLITASSGGGKSFLLRKLLEESHGKIQQIVLDMEGEFASLRERYDYILAGKGGDISADIRSAEILAKKILELEASIIIDLYELKHHDRIKFVKLFCDALVNAPKELWHPALVIIDEGHVFAPERSEAESLSAVIDLATRGRKRGYGLIIATQRLSKLHKDTAAELLNKLVGLTSLDIDRKRASEELGFLGKEQVLSLRDLEPGEFYAVGPAISKSVIKVKIGQVKTTHAKAGQRYGGKTPIPMPTSKVTAILAKLTDLPQEAQKELKDKQDMLGEITRLRRELTMSKQGIVKKPEIDPKQLDAYYQRGLREGEKNSEQVVKEANQNIVKLQRTINSIRELLGSQQVPAKLIEAPRHVQTLKPIIESIQPIGQRRVEDYWSGKSHDNDTKFNRCERAILKFLAMRDQSRFTKVQIGAMTNYSANSGGFNNALSKLSKAELIIRDGGDSISINSNKIQEVIAILGDEYNTEDQNALESWMNQLPKCDREIYKVVKDEPTRTFTKEELGEITNYSSNSGGFNNALSHLNTLGLIERSNEGIRFSSKLLEMA